MTKARNLSAKVDRIATLIALVLADLEDVRDELAQLADAVEAELDDGLSFK